MLGLVVLALARGSDLVLRIGVRLGAVAFLALVAAIVLGWPRLVPLSAGLLGSAYAVYLAVDDVRLDATAPVFAAGLFLTVELAYWSLEERERVRTEAEESIRRIAVVASFVLAAVVTSATLLALADAVRTRGFAIDLIGAAAAAAVLVVVVALSRPNVR